MVGKTVGCFIACSFRSGMRGAYEALRAASWKDLTLRGDAAGLAQRADERRRRRPGKLAKVAVQVRLVEVAAVERNLHEPTRRGPERGDCAVEPQHACRGLRREPDVLAEASDQPAVAPAGLRGELPDVGS